MERTKSMRYQETVKSRDLCFYAINNGDLYRHMTTPLIANLKKKADKGMYDVEKAVDDYYNIASEASKMYEKEFGYSFSVADQFTTAVDLEENYRNDEILSSLIKKYGRYSPETKKFQASVFDALNQRGQQEGREDTFTIFQVSNGAPIEYRSPSYMQENGLLVDMKNYDRVYAAPLVPGMDLDQIYAKFNNDHPGFNRYLDTSDVIVLHQDGKDKAYWLDGNGFSDITRDYWLTVTHFQITQERQAAKETRQNNQRPSLLENLHKKQEQIKSGECRQPAMGIESRSYEKMDRTDAR